MNDALQTFLTVALTISVLTAFSGGVAAQPTTVDAGTAPADVDAGLDAPAPLDGVDTTHSMTAWNNTTDPCTPFWQWGVIC
jgi:hypothetical protein